MPVAGSFSRRHFKKGPTNVQPGLFSLACAVNLCSCFLPAAFYGRHIHHSG
jgi:hypothetical protein